MLEELSSVVIWFQNVPRFPGSRAATAQRCRTGRGTSGLFCVHAFSFPISALSATEQPAEGRCQRLSLVGTVEESS